MNPFSRIFAPPKQPKVCNVALTIDRGDGALQVVHVRLLTADADKLARRLGQISTPLAEQGRGVVAVIGRPGRRPLVARQTVPQPELDELLAFLSEIDR